YAGGAFGAVNSTAAVDGIKVIGGSLNLSGTVLSSTQGGLIGASYRGADAKVSTLKNSSTENFDITRKSFVTSGWARMAGAVAEGVIHADNVHVKGGTIDISGDGVDAASRGNRFNGGFAGCVSGDTKLTNCSTSANTVVNDPLATDCLGGFLGVLNGTPQGVASVLDNCRATGTISIGAGVNHSPLGGFIGLISSYQDVIPRTIKNCYTSTKISGAQAASLSGFVGRINDAASASITTYENNMWVKNTTMAGSAVGGGAAVPTGIYEMSVTPLSNSITNLALNATSPLTATVPTYTGADAVQWKFGGWSKAASDTVVQLINPTSPTAASVRAMEDNKATSITAKFTRVGYEDINIPISVGTGGGWIVVDTWEKFVQVGGGGAFPANGKYIQTANITAPAGTAYTTKALFSGVYDGGGFSIDCAGIAKDKWTANADDASYIRMGLFGGVCNAGALQNINVKNIDMQGSALMMGGLAAEVWNSTLKNITVQNIRLNNLGFAASTQSEAHAGAVAGHMHMSNASDITVKDSNIKATNERNTFAGGMFARQTESSLTGTNKVQNTIVEAVQ
ncbi:MAG: hypothetical protein RSC25_08015, partial [Christensenella sp.]